MSPFKFVSFTLKAFAAIIVHLSKIDILKLRTERSSSFDSNISALVVATCIACMFSKINLSPHLQSLSNWMIYILELSMTVYGTELTIHMIWVPLLQTLLWMCTKLGKSLMSSNSRYKFAVDDQSNCIEQDLFCYLNICLALFVASNTLANFDCIKQIKSLWPSTLPSTLPPDTNTMVNNESKTVPSAKLNNTTMADAVIVSRKRPKKKSILLMNVR